MIMQRARNAIQIHPPPPYTGRALQLDRKPKEKTREKERENRVERGGKNEKKKNAEQGNRHRVILWNMKRSGAADVTRDHVALFS